MYLLSYLVNNIIVVLLCDPRQHTYEVKIRSSTHLELAFTWEDADPFVVIVCNDDVTVGVDGHAGRPLQLTRSPAPDTEAAFELTVIWENLQRKKKKKKHIKIRSAVFRKETRKCRGSDVPGYWPDMS